MTYRIKLKDNQFVWVDNVKYVTMYKDMFNFVQNEDTAVRVSIDNVIEWTVVIS